MSRTPKSRDIEAEDAPPEADRLEGFAHPRETVVLYGQDTAQTTMASALASGRMHHAWLMAGPEGVGKATLAYRFARAALALPAERGPDLSVPPGSVAARQVSSLTHPGLMLIRRPWQRDNKKHAQGIPVDEVRRIKGFLQLSASTDAFRVVIIDRAEDMAAAAANALLKALEEPPPRTIFLLISSEPGRLLPTIHSRCRRLDLLPLNDADLLAAVSAALTAAGNEAPKPEALQLIAGLSDGSVRRALTLLGGGAADLHSRVVRMLADLPRLDTEAVHRLADGLTGATNEAEFLIFFNLLQGVLARCLRRAATGEPMLPGETAFGVQLVRAGSERLAGWADAWEAIARDKAAALALNLDRKALVLGVWERLRSVA